MIIKSLSFYVLINSFLTKRQTACSLLENLSKDALYFWKLSIIKFKSVFKVLSFHDNDGASFNVVIIMFSGFL